MSSVNSDALNVLAKEKALDEPPGSEIYTVGTSKLRLRLIELIDMVTLKHRRFRQLEQWTGCPADSWRKFYVGRQRCTEEMLEGLCRNFPSLSMWIVTGQVDYANKQYDPVAKNTLDQHSLSSVLDKAPSSLDSFEVLRLQIELARRMMIISEAKSDITISRLLQAIEVHASVAPQDENDGHKAGAFVSSSKTYRATES